ncbi:MAG: NAD kinase [bacterium]|nr:MAG: NAD kinase [bacterium]
MPEVKLSRIGIVIKPESGLAPEAVGRILAWGKNKGVEFVLDEKTAGLSKAKGVDQKTFLDSVDALIVLGGDGTMLAVARMVKEKSIPLLGVNLGNLGFMTEVAFGEIETALDKIFSGNYAIEERMMLDFFVENGSVKNAEVALNEVVFGSKSTARMVELSTTVNGQHVNRYRADGLIVSTPTGSTAYALSAGGPILYPVLDSLLICPICPHTLTNRPIVIPGDAEIGVHIIEGQEDIIATIDGQVSIDITDRDRLTLRRSDKVTRLIKVPDRTHYEALRSKLGWGGTSDATC